MKIYLQFTDKQNCSLILEENDGNVIYEINDITSWGKLGVELSCLIINSQITFNDSFLFLKKCSEDNVFLSDEIEDSGFPRDYLQLRLIREDFYKILILEGVKNGEDFYWELGPLYTWTYVEFALSHFVFGGYMDLREAHNVVEIEKLNDPSFPQYPDDMSAEAKQDMEYKKILDELSTEEDPN